MHNARRLHDKQKKLLLYCSLMLFLTRGGDVRAQDQTSSEPQTHAQNKPMPKDSEPKKNDWIFGVIPNYRAIEKPMPGEKPHTTKEKFNLAIEDSFDPYAYPIAGRVGTLRRRVFPLTAACTLHAQPPMAHPVAGLVPPPIGRACELGFLRHPVYPSPNKEGKLAPCSLGISP